MSLIFVSHSSRDRAATEQICQLLREAGFEALFLDIDCVDGIPAGGKWEREIYSHMRMSDAVVFLASEDAAGSRWAFTELTLAKSIGCPIRSDRD